MIWILIILGGYNGSTATVVERYYSEEKCQATAQQISARKPYATVLCVSADKTAR